MKPILSILMVLFLCACVGTLISAQEDVLSHEFHSYQVLDIKTSNSYRDSKSRSDQVIMTFPSIDGSEDIAFEMYPSDVISDDYVLTISDGNGMIERKGTDVVPMYGYAVGDPSMKITLTMAPDYMVASIRGNNIDYYIEPLNKFDKSAQSGRYVMYRSSDVKPHDGTCGHTSPKNISSQVEEKRVRNNYRAGDCYIVDYYVSSDSDMYSDFGNNVSAVESHVISIMNLMNTDYDDSFADEI